MKKLFYFLLLAGIAVACNDNTGAENRDPSEVHPPSEALPDTLQLVNDSAVMVDPTGDTGVKAKVGASDSIHRERQ